MKIKFLILTLALCYSVAQAAEIPARKEQKFSFAMIADPQVGPEQFNNPVYQNATRTLRLACEEINAMKNVAFTISLGDIVNSYEPKSVDNFVKSVKTLTAPLYLVHGNHDSRFPFTEYKKMSKDLTGIDDMYYSFDAGGWHFVILPSQIDTNKSLMANADYAKYVNQFTAWLKEDLEKNKQRPTAVFEHFHLIPLGMSQLEWYTFTRDRRLELLDILAKNGNVKYYFNGHIHNGIRPSIKMTRTYKGITFVTVPTVILSRPLSDEFPEYASGDQTGGYYMTVDVDKDKFTLWGHLVGNAKPYKYPATFAAMDETVEPRWWRSIPEFKATPKLVNGDFAQGLDGWYKTFRYQSDNTPPYTCAAKRMGDRNTALIGVTAVPPELWGNDEYNAIYQIVAAPRNPVLSANVYLPVQQTAGGGYVLVTAMNDKGLSFMFFFRWGNRVDEYNADFLPRAIMTDYTNTESALWGYLQTLAKRKQAIFVDLPDAPGKWVNINVNLPELYNRATSKMYGNLKIDRFYVGLGTWAGNKVGSQSFANFADISLSAGTGKAILIDDKEPDLSHVFETQFGQKIIDKQAKK